MSPLSSEEKRSGNKGKRRSIMPGRFSPDQPLHMTTRRAAKTSVVNGETSSLNGSVADADSRRESFEDLRPTTSRSIGSQSSIKSGQLPDASESLFNPSGSQNTYPSFDETNSAIEVSQPSSPSQSASLLSRKRKRSSSPSASKSSIALLPEAPADDAVAMDIADGEDVSVIDASQLSDGAASEAGTSESEEQPNDNVVTAPPSTDVTPLPSNGGSPASSMSGSDNGTPLKNVTDLDDAAILDDEGEALEGADAADDIDDVDDQAQSGDDGRPKRRMGGRKRVAHPITRVETAMRRQADVKTAYRQITRALKSLLVELTQRTSDQLEEGPESYKDAPEYTVVKSGLDDALEKRQKCIRAQFELDKKLLQDRLQTEEFIRLTQLKLQLADFDDDQLHQVEQTLIAIARNVELNGETQYNTDDEDDIVPRLKQGAYRYKRGPALDLKFDSRSRVIMETSKAVSKMNARHRMNQMLRELDAADRPEGLKTFTVMDSEPREIALNKRESLARTRLLADAAAEIDRVSKIPVIPNEQATGLQLLGDLAARPPIKIPAPRDAKHSRGMGGGPPLVPALPGLSGHRSGFQPSPLQLSSANHRSRVEIVDTSMPPPSTPRQTPTAATFSPGFKHLERPTPDAMHPNGRPSLPPTSPGYESRFGSEPSAYRSREWSEQRQDTTHHKREFSQEYDLRRLPPWNDSHQPSQMDIDRRPQTQDSLGGVELPPILSVPPPFSGGNQRRNSRGSDNERASQPRDILNRRPSLHDQRNIPPLDRQSLPPPPFVFQGFEHPAPASTSIPSLWRPASEASRPSPQAPLTISLDNQELRTDGGESQRRQKDKSYQGPFRKTSKDERSGEPRRKSRKNSAKQSPSQPLLALASNPEQAAANGPESQMAPPHSAQSAIDPALLPPGPPHAPPPFYGRPPPQQLQPYPYAQPPYEPQSQSHHRHSFPSTQGSPSNWHSAPHSSLYAMPQGPSASSPPPPPPPGAPADPYHSQSSYSHPPPFFRPLAPGMREHPPPPPPPPTTSSSHYESQYGGPALAPAPSSQDPRYQTGGHGQGHQHLPAFAQQRQNEASRKRAQSDAQKQPRIHQWTPGPKKWLR